MCLQCYWCIRCCPIDLVENIEISEKKHSCAYLPVWKHYGMKLTNKFNGKNFNLWKFKMEMILMEFRICGRLLKASRKLHHHVLMQTWRRCVEIKFKKNVHHCDQFVWNLLTFDGGMKHILQHSWIQESIQHLIFKVQVLHTCEMTFCPSTPSSMRWLYLEIHMLLMKEKCKTCL